MQTTVARARTRRALFMARKLSFPKPVAGFRIPGSQVHNGVTLNSPPGVSPVEVANGGEHREPLSDPRAPGVAPVPPLHARRGKGFGRHARYVRGNSAPPRNTGPDRSC